MLICVWTTIMDKYLIKRKREDDGDNDVKKLKSDGAAEKATPKENEGKQEEHKDPPKLITMLEGLKIDPNSQKSPKEWQDKFAKMAEFLLNEVTLFVNNKKHRLVEVEFYFTCATHDDPYTHKDKVQETCANWYFHRTNGVYRTGNYKGLDISIGNNNKEVGGILIRSIESISPSKFVCGPCKSVDHILETCQVSSINELVDVKMNKDISVSPPADGSSKILYLKHTPTELQRRPILCCPRVGLHMTKKGNVEGQKRYLFKFYRFLTQPKQVFKGRHYSTMGLYFCGKKIPDIQSILGYNPERYVKLIEEGKKMDPQKFVGRRLEDNEVCQAFGALAGTYLT